MWYMNKILAQKLQSLTNMIFSSFDDNAITQNVQQPGHCKVTTWPQHSFIPKYKCVTCFNIKGFAYDVTSKL